MKTNEKIIHASLQLFNEHGERSITTNHIAAHLGISPGNLYYHFKNKQDIIRSIFDNYEHFLNTSFQPYQANKVTVDLLISYFDIMFEIPWRFRFMYTNLNDILSRDEGLSKRYLVIQNNALQRSCDILSQLKQDGLLDVADNKIIRLADTMRMIACFWIGYQQTHTEEIKITAASLYEGLLRVIMLFKAHATEQSMLLFDKVEQHYEALSLQYAEPSAN